MFESNAILLGLARTITGHWNGNSFPIVTHLKRRRCLQNINSHLIGCRCLKAAVITRAVELSLCDRLFVPFLPASSSCCNTPVFSAVFFSYFVGHRGQNSEKIRPEKAKTFVS